MHLLNYALAAIAFLSIALITVYLAAARASALAKGMSCQLRDAGAQSERLAEIAKRTSNAVVVTDSRGRIEWVNEGFSRITGYALAEVIGKTPGSILQGAATDPSEVRRISAAIHRGETVRGELVNYSKTGRAYTIEMEVAPLHNSAGAINGFMAIETDVTARRDSERRLVESEANFRTLADSAPIFVWTSQPDGRRNYFNQPWLEFRGRTFEQERDFGWLEGVHPDELDRYQDILTEAVSLARPFEVEYRLRRCDGVYRNVLGRGVPRYSVDGQFSGYVGACSDVTDMREAQQRAESANSAKSEFLANMSHEIRTPLTAILGFTDLLREEQCNAQTPQQRRKNLETIRNAGVHLLTVINDILDLSKIEADKMTVEQAKTPVVQIIHEVTSLMRSRALGKGVALESELTTPIPDSVMSDPTRFRQILMNLVGNAAKFTEAGEVKLSTRVEASDGRDWLVVDISDTGPGMNEEQAKRLFQPFSQADTTMARKFGGTGLGLSICWRLASLMGGMVSLVYTKPGNGSTFRLKLPLQVVPGAVLVDSFDSVTTMSSPLATAPTITLQGRILLAEDGPDNQRLIAFHLRKAGAVVDLAENGAIALGLIQKSEAEATPYDLLLTDMQMPEMDGYTLARMIKQLGIQLPIVALTAHAMAEDSDRCLQAGCDAYCTKPIDKSLLLATCAAWIRTPSGVREVAA